MAEYFERDNFITRIEYYITHTPKSSGEHYAYSIVLNEMLNCPTADVVPVVRCKDCVHYDLGVCLKIYSDGNAHPEAWQPRRLEDFCSYGERKEKANES